MPALWQASALCAQHICLGKVLSVAGVQALYRDKAELESGVRGNIPGFKGVGELEYGFKIRDRTVPEKWYEAVEVTALPAERDVPKNPVQGLQQSFGGIMNSLGGKK